MISMQDTISVLKGLIVACHGSEQACDESAETIPDTKGKAVWREVARQQGKMATELEQAVVRLGGDLRHGGLASTRQLLWSAAEAVDETASCAVCGHWGDAQRETYRRALQADLPLNVHMLVQRQYVEISAVRERFRQLDQARGKVKMKLSRSVPRATTWFDF